MNDQANESAPAPSKPDYRSKFGGLRKEWQHHMNNLTCIKSIPAGHKNRDARRAEAKAAVESRRYYNQLANLKFAQLRDKARRAAKRGQQPTAEVSQ